MSRLKNKAQEVLKIIDQGGFYLANGEWVNIRNEIDYAINYSKTYAPEEHNLLTISDKITNKKALEIEVTSETTQIAASRLINAGYDNLVLLNYASAKNAGGGFINGAKAQEEDLTRCSTLYPCLRSQTTYYHENRKEKSMLYTDYIIYSPKVPWFRIRSRDDPETVFLASVITAPAPNANQARRRWIDAKTIENALRRRCGLVLGVAKENGHRNILLGAWGCGVFGNNPMTVANAFKTWLLDPVFEGAFDHVTFAVFDRSKGKVVFNAFKKEFL